MVADFSIPGGWLPTPAPGSSPAIRAELDQIAFFTETQIGVPAGVTYTTTGVSRISATEINVDFQIAVQVGTTPGLYDFQVEYGLLDSNQQPLGPLTGNLFDFTLEVLP